MKLLILGANGMLGSRLCRYLEDLDYVLHKWGRKEFWLNYKNLYTIIKEERIERIVNLIALTDVNQCELYPHEAYLSNVQTVEKIINAIKLSKVPLIHISTDHLYNTPGKSKEIDINICNTYALTKYSAEIVARSVNATILRTTYVAKSAIKGKYSFVDWLINSIKSNAKMYLYSDVVFSPLYGETLCKIIEKIIINPISGTFNLGTIDSISKANFSLELAKELNLDIKNATVCKIDSHNLKTKRPLDMSLDVSKFEKTFEIILPSTHETIMGVASEYKVIN